MNVKTKILEELVFLMNTQKSIFGKRIHTKKDLIYSLMGDYWRGLIFSPKYYDRLLIKENSVFIWNKKVYTINLIKIEKGSIDSSNEFVEPKKSHSKVIQLLEEMLDEAAREMYVRFLCYFGLPEISSSYIFPINEDGAKYKYQSVRVTDNMIHNPVTGVIRDSIFDHKCQDILVCGNSASGKTVAVKQAVQIISTRDYTNTWIDLADVGISMVGLIHSVLKTNVKDNHVIVIDNVQACPSRLTQLELAINILNQLLPNVNIFTIIISWTSAKAAVTAIYTNLKIITCTGEKLIENLIIENGQSKYAKQIINNSCGDVLVAHHTIKFICQQGRYPTENEISYLIYRECLHQQEISQEAQHAIYHVAALGIFEIHVRERYLISISKLGYRELTKKNIIRTYITNEGDVYISIGHRSMAHKIVSWLQSVRVDKSKYPIDMAINYLKIEGNQQIHSTLERLDLELIESEHMLGDLWHAFLSVKSCIQRQIYKDATWGESVGSMIFAAQALKYMSFDTASKELWTQVAQLIRTLWVPSPQEKCIKYIGEQTKYKYGVSSEIIDFAVKIPETMTEEEKLIEYPNNMLAKNLNCKKLHENWLLGMLLGLEGVAFDDSSSERKKEFLECAYLMQEPDGAFYPQRVCWVTARVIIGLCECGLTYSDQIVRDSCNWLIEQYKCSSSMVWAIEYMDCGGWVSGTGSWNTNEQATLMCLSALSHAKYPISHNSDMQYTIDCIWNYRQKLVAYFIENNTADDTMWIIDVMMTNNKNLLEMKDEIKSMTAYVRKIWTQASDLANEKNTESCNVSFMAEELLKIIWVLLTDNIEQLLKGLEQSYDTYKPHKKIFISYRRREGGGAIFAQNIYKYLNENYINDVFLDVYDLKKECEEFATILDRAISNCSIFIAIITDNAFARCLEKGYNPNRDIFYTEITSAINNNKNIISVYNNSIECPDQLKTNPKMYNVALLLAKRNAVIYRADLENSIERMIDEILIKIENVFK